MNQLFIIKHSKYISNEWLTELETKIDEHNVQTIHKLSYVYSNRSFTSSHLPHEGEQYSIGQREKWVNQSRADTRPTIC